MHIEITFAKLGQLKEILKLGNPPSEPTCCLYQAFPLASQPNRFPKDRCCQCDQALWNQKCFGIEPRPPWRPSSLPLPQLSPSLPRADEFEPPAATFCIQRIKIRCYKHAAHGFKHEKGRNIPPIFLNLQLHGDIILDHIRLLLHPAISKATGTEDTLLHNTYSFDYYTYAPRSSTRFPAVTTTTWGAAAGEELSHSSSPSSAPAPPPAPARALPPREVFAPPATAASVALAFFF